MTRIERTLPESTRVEAFSDGVLAIALTLLVLDLHSDFDPSDFTRGLGAQWPAYVAYLAAFLNISAIWVNHHDLFSRIARVDASLICLNLAMLLVASLFPFPAAVISAAIRTGDRHDQIASCVVYAGVGFFVPITFMALYSYVRHATHLLTDQGQVAYADTARRRALVSVVVYPVTAALAFVSPDLSLALFVAVPVFFVVAVFRQERFDERDHHQPPAP